MTEMEYKPKGPVYRESASLIICAKNRETINGYDYKLLMLKRSDRTALFKNQGVFPGGIYDTFDESVEWLKYFEEFGVTQQSLKDLLVIDGIAERPRILAPQGNGCYDRFFKKSKIWAREISLRITAIRETFEEVGVFLCRTREQLNASNEEGIFKVDFDKSKWQKAVHDDPKQFLQMCKELQVIPDLWGIHEWSCWASPAIIKKGYETAFFVTFLNEIPKVLCEESEVKECLWLPPLNLLQMVRDTELFFLPPQIYEISRFIPYKSYEYLKKFSVARHKLGITMYHPIGYFCTDGIVSILPGDDFFTGDPRLATELRSLDYSLAEFRARSKCINRIENAGNPNAILRCNIKPLDGHLVPFCGDIDEKHKL